MGNKVSVEDYEVLEEELRLSRNLNSHLSNSLDRYIAERDRIYGILRDVDEGKEEKETAIDRIGMVVGWRGNVYEEDR